MIKHSIDADLAQQGLWFVVNRGKIWLPKQQLPLGRYDSLNIEGQPDQICWLGHKEQLPVYLVVNHDFIEHEQDWVSARDLLAFGETVFQFAARAVQVALFLQTHRFCGQCGSAMQLVNWELAMLCHKCGHRCYPRIAPCVLVGIQHQGKILLARSSRHRSGFYSILAGFVESAETLEQAAIREVKEEVGVDICNLRYVGSQPWPFPHSLMTGFIADYAGGEIRCQPEEIEEAHWFDFSQLPEVPPVETLSGQIIRQLGEIAGK